MTQPATTVRSPASVERAGEILRLLRERNGRTISELATQTGLARSTVHQRLTALGEQGLIAFGPSAVGARGRPAQATRFVADSAVVLAVHVGLTGSRAAVVDLAGELLADAYVDVAVADGPDALVAALSAAGTDLLTGVGADGRLAGVGVGLPSRTDLVTGPGTGDGAPQDWSRGRLASRLRTALGAPVFTDLDVNLLALAERFRRSTDRGVLVCVKLGTVIDAAIVVNGEPVRGVDDLAGELGHVKVAGSDAPCDCGGTGCLDAVASGRALVRRLRSEGLAVDHVRDVVALAGRDDPRAVATIRAAGRVIGQALATVVTLLNPGVVAVWGYLSEAESPLFAGMREGLYADALPSASAHVELVRTASGQLSGVRGAATMVLSTLLEPAAVDRLLVTGDWVDAWPDDPDPGTLAP